MRLGIQTSPQGCSFTELRDYWHAADELGLHAAYTSDHLVPLRPLEGPGWPGDGDRRGGQLEGWLSVAALAIATKALRVGVLVSDVTLRAPALLAKMAVTLDHVSAGRAVLGVGAGWHAEEHGMFGFPLPPARERVDRLLDALPVLRAATVGGTNLTYTGTHYRLHDAYSMPGPVSTPSIPIVVGGSGPRVRSAACRFADGLSSFGTPSDWVRNNAELDEQLRRHGRSPQDLVRSAYVFADLSGDRAAEATLLADLGRRGSSSANPSTQVVAVLADPSQALATLEDYAAAGVTEVVLGLRPPYRIDDLERFATAVVPQLGQGRDCAPSDRGI